MLKLYKTHQGQILGIAILLAFPLGIFIPHLFIHLSFISQTFINLLKLCALPIICTSLIVTIGTLPKPQELKKVALNSAYYIILSEVIAVSIGLIILNSINLGHGINPQALLKGATSHNINTMPITLNQIFDYLFTSNIFASLTHFDVLPIVIFAIMLGLTCTFKQTEAKPLLDVMVSVRHIFLHLLTAVMYIAPIAIFVLIGQAIADSYLTGSLMSNLLGLLRFVGVFILALFIHFLWQLIAVLILNRRLNAKTLLGKSGPMFTTAFISSSSIVTLPTAMETAKDLGAETRVVDFMLPVCASMNFASGMLYEIIAALFFLQVLGIHLSLTHQILLAMTCILTGIAVGGIPETSMVSLVIVFNLANIPLSAISILLPLDRILDRIRTMVNIFGNTCGTLIVSKFNRSTK